jgi:hypothetical protein
MLNLVRGEVPLVVRDKTYILCLTLGALAEIETSLGIDDITQIGEVFKKPKASHVMEITLALLHGGADDSSPERMAQSAMTIQDVAKLPLQMNAILGPMKAAFEASTALIEDDAPGKP